MPNIYVIFEKDPYHQGFESLFSSIGLTTIAIQYSELVADIQTAANADLFFVDLTRFERRSVVISELQEKCPRLPVVVTHMENELSYADLTDYENVIEYIPQPIAIPDLAGMILNAWHGYISEYNKTTKIVKGLLQEQNPILLIQSFVTSKQSGVISLETEMKHGKLLLKEGNLYDAQYNDLEPGLALNKMLLWLDGRYQITYTDITDKRNIKMDVETIIANGFERISQFLSLRDALGGHGVTFYSVTQYDPKPFKEKEIKVLQSFVMGKTLSAHLTSSDSDDLDELRFINDLTQKGFLFSSKTKRDEVDEKNKGLAKLFSKISIFNKEDKSPVEDMQKRNIPAAKETDVPEPYMRRFAVAQLNELKEKLKLLAE